MKDAHYTLKKLDKKIRKCYKQIEYYNSLKKDLIQNNLTDIPKEEPTKNYYIYTIKCENDYYYVGQTTNPERRFKQHQSGKASWFTRQHKPIEIIDSIPIGVMTQSKAMEWENKKTAQLIKQYGLHKVRGGAFIQKNHKYFINKLNQYQKIKISYLDEEISVKHY